MIRAVLFDFGGVILSSPFEAFNDYEREAGLAPDTIRTINATDPDRNAWARFERSELDVTGFIAAFEQEAAALGHIVDARRVLDGLRGRPRPEMVEALRRVGAHHKTALLTNNVLVNDNVRVAGDGAGNRNDELAAIHDLFDEIVESSVVGVRKPEVRFYEIACERLGVAPSECVFLDDLGINLKPARAMGMTTIKVGEPGAALAELEAVLGLDLTGSVR